MKMTGAASSRTVTLRLCGFSLTLDQPAAYSRYRAALGTFSIPFGVKFCFGGGLQKIGGNGISLSLMWCGCGFRASGAADNSFSHTGGGCGDSRNQVETAAVGRLPTRIREEEER